jgi:hypothetical protein
MQGGLARLERKMRNEVSANRAELKKQQRAEDLGSLGTLYRRRCGPAGYKAGSLAL